MHPFPTPQAAPPAAYARIAAELLALSPAGEAIEPHLAAALTDALGQPGQLIRAQLLLRGATAQGLSETDGIALAVGVEYFHLASLLLDDLPCMDDAHTRRGRPCLHRVHGEATTILAVLALINRAYALVHETIARQPSSSHAAARRCLEAALGTRGIVGGQARDLRFCEKPRPPREVLRIAAKKTGALFQLSIYLPALLGQPNPSESRTLRALCIYWGLIYQVMDDLNDVLSTSFDTGKTSGRDTTLNRPNLALAIGVPEARRHLIRLLKLAGRTLQRLDVSSRRWSYLVDFHRSCFEKPALQKALLGARSAA